MTRPLLALNAIVKDESASIKDILENIKPWIDQYSIIDTGSTDGTQDIIRETLKDVSGVLVDGPFNDFSDARNRALALEASQENPAIFCLVLSGDEYVRHGDKLREHLEKHRETNVDCHWLGLSIRGVSMSSPRVFRTGSRWRYAGVVHEIPVNIDKDSPMSHVEGAYIEHIESDPEARLNAIWVRHIPLLKAELEKNPNDERSLLFLAQSYEALFCGFDPEERLMYAQEALDLRRRRLAIPTGTDEERNYVMMHMIDTARETGLFNSQELFTWVMAHKKEDSKRPETALLAAELAIPCAPLTKVYELACDAAKVATEAQTLTSSSPIDSACLWKAHRLAAVAARQLAVKYPDEFGSRVREHISAALAAGAQWEFLKELTVPLPA